MFTIRGVDGKEYGPVTEDQLREWIRQRRANGQTEVQEQGSTDWKTLSTYPQFSADLSTPSTPPPSQPATPGAAPAMNVPGAVGTGHAPVYSNAPTSNGMSIASMILGIMSLICCGMLGMVCAIIAIILGGMAISKINQNPDVYGGKGMAITGVVTGSLGLIIGLALTVWLLTGGLEEVQRMLEQQ